MMRKSPLSTYRERQALHSLLDQPEDEQQIWGQILNITHIDAKSHRPCTNNKTLMPQHNTVRIKSTLHPPLDKQRTICLIGGQRTHRQLIRRSKYLLSMAKNNLIQDFGSHQQNSIFNIREASTKSTTDTKFEKFISQSQSPELKNSNKNRLRSLSFVPRSKMEQNQEKQSKAHLRKMIQKIQRPQSFSLYMKQIAPMKVFEEKKAKANAIG